MSGASVVSPGSRLYVTQCWLFMQQGSSWHAVGKDNVLVTFTVVNPFSIKDSTPGTESEQDLVKGLNSFCHIGPGVTSRV